MKRSLIILATVALAGCGTIKGELQNRITTTIACDRGFVASLYGPIGITSEIDALDVAQLPCAARDNKAKAAAPAASAAK